jgi:hypothetical protein
MKAPSTTKVSTIQAEAPHGEFQGKVHKEFLQPRSRKLQRGISICPICNREEFTRMLEVRIKSCRRARQKGIQLDEDQFEPDGILAMAIHKSCTLVFLAST